MGVQYRSGLGHTHLPLVSIALLVTIALWASIFTYSPGHIRYLSRRFAYYVFGDESVDVLLVLRQGIAAEVRKGWNGLKAIGGKEL